MTFNEWAIFGLAIFIVFGIGYLTAEKKHTKETWIDIFFD